ncbi:hypothetical protein D3C75_1123280 [compost metagenome]
MPSVLFLHCRCWEQVWPSVLFLRCRCLAQVWKLVGLELEWRLQSMAMPLRLSLYKYRQQETVHSEQPILHGHPAC